MRQTSSRGVWSITALAMVLVFTAGCDERSRTEKLIEKTRRKKTKHPALTAAVEPEIKEVEVERPPEPAKVPEGSGALDTGKPLEPFIGDEALSSDAKLRSSLLRLRSNRPSKAWIRKLKSNRKSASQALIQGLWHQHTNVRSQSASLLAEIGAKGPDVEAALRRSLRTEPDSDVRSIACKALVTLKFRSFVPLLIELLGRDGAHSVRSNAAYALGTIGDKRATDALIGALSDKETWVRLRAVTAMRRVRNKKAVPSLERALSDPNILVRQAAVRSLKAITGRRYSERTPRLQ